MSPQSLCEKEAFLRPSCFFCSRPNKFPTRVPPSSIQPPPPPGLDRLCIFTQISALVGRSMKSRTNFSLSLPPWHVVAHNENAWFSERSVLGANDPTLACFCHNNSANECPLTRNEVVKVHTHAILRMSRERNAYVITRFSPLHIWMKFQEIRWMSTAMASEIKLPAKKNEVTNFIYDHVKISLFNYRSAALRRRRRRRTLEVTMCRSLLSLSLSHTSPLALPA